MDLYRRYGSFLRERFGRAVRRIPLDAGLGCPHRSAGTGGCAWCNEAAFHPYAATAGLAISEQVAHARSLRSRDRDAALLAYFQTGTNTHAEPHRLAKLWDEALACEGVVGLAIGTRPDCLPGPVIDLLRETVRRAYVQLELGLQTANDATLRRMNRGHDVACFRDACERLRGFGVVLGAHLIIGLPGETQADALQSARCAVESGVRILKLHSFHVVRGSALAREPLPRLWSLKEYVAAVADLLERLPEEVVIDRLSATAPADLLLGPDWCADAHLPRARIEAELQRRGTRQGSRAGAW